MQMYLCFVEQFDGNTDRARHGGELGFFTWASSNQVMQGKGTCEKRP